MIPKSGCRFSGKDHAQNKELARRVGALPQRYLKVVGYHAARMCFCGVNFRTFLLAGSAKKKPGPCGPGCSLPAEADNHLPEGNSWLHTLSPPGRNGDKAAYSTNQICAAS